MLNDNEKEQKVKEILFNSKEYVQYKFIKFGIKAMRNKNLYEAEALVYSLDDKDKDKNKILYLVHKEMDKRGLIYAK